MGESKYRILEKIDRCFVPKTLYYTDTPARDTVLSDIQKIGISFPFVVKPDIGQGGWLIEMIHDSDDLCTFLQRIKMPFLVQEYVDYPIELGVLYYRYPCQARGTISSLAVKELLNVTGDGTSSIALLIKNHPRAKRSVTTLQPCKKIDLKYVPAKGEKIYLSFIANHSYGTTFINGNDLIDDKITSFFDTLSKRISGFYFGRFDIRCKSMEDLRQGCFKVLELNGVGSEPLHIFDPKEKIFNAWGSAFEHWRIIYEISKMNKAAGIRYMTFKESRDIYKNLRRIQRIHHADFVIGN